MLTPNAAPYVARRIAAAKPDLASRARLAVLLLTCWQLLGSYASAAEPLRRIGHSDVRQACLSDGSARLQHYWDVAAFDWGGVVPLNSWYHPQLLHFEPQSGLLEHRAVALPHQGQGNEDDPRQRLHASKGPDAKSSHVLFTIFGYEEIDDENGNDARDSAVMSLNLNPVEGSNRLPRRNARVVNLSPTESRRGLGSIPASCGSPYDAQRRIVFAPRDRPSELESKQLFQMFRLDEEGRLSRRQSVLVPTSFRKRHATTFMDVSPKYGLIALGAVTPWSPVGKRASLYLLRYASSRAADKLADVHSPVSSDDLTIRKGGVAWEPHPTAGVFCDDGKDVFLLVAGGRPPARYAGDMQGGVYVFRLGPINGPYSLGSPVGLLPIPAGVEELKIYQQRLYASSNGLFVFDLAKTLRSRGVIDELARVDSGLQVGRYPLPYDTHGFDFAQIGGRKLLFLAAGRNGLDTFEMEPFSQSAAPQAQALKPQKSKPERHRLRGREIQVVLRSGGQFSQFGKPSVDGRGDIYCWAVTREGHEAIVKVAHDRSEVLISSKRGPYVAFGRPTCNGAGQVAFWAATKSGLQTIVATNANRELTERIKPGAFRVLRDPRNSANGRILFLGLPAARKARQRAIFLSDSGEPALTTLFDERGGDGRIRLGVGLPGDFAADYDISSDGKQAAFVVREVKPHQRDHLYLWDNGRRRDLGSLGRDMQFVRFGTNDRHLTFRRWKDEVLATSRIALDASSSGGGLVETARRRSRYGNNDVNPGEFIGARSDRAGNVMMSIVENVQTARGAMALGDQIWRYDHADKRVEFWARPEDKLGERTILSAAFLDSLAPDGSVAARIDLKAKSASGPQLQQAIVVWPAGDAARNDK